jgi:hypothetical protein
MHVWSRSSTLRAMLNQVMITIEGPNFQDVEELELLNLPVEGDPVETKYGTCIVTRAEVQPQDDRFAARVTCRLP